MAVTPGEPHPQHPMWRAAETDGQPDGWMRRDGLHLRGAGQSFTVTRRGILVYSDEYAPRLPDVGVVMKQIDKSFPYGGSDE